MRRKSVFSLCIWGWQARNSKWIYGMISSFFLILIPVIGMLFRRKTPVVEYHVIYGYVLYIAQTVVFALGCIPFLMERYLFCHLEIGDCIVLCPEWRERKQYLIHYFFIAVLLSLMMILLILIFRRGIPMTDFLTDLASLLVIAWFLLSVSSLVAAGGHNVYLTLILMEFYGVLFWNMGVWLDAVWNVFSLTGTEGAAWGIRILLYFLLGAVMRGIAEYVGKQNVKEL